MISHLEPAIQKLEHLPLITRKSLNAIEELDLRSEETQSLIETARARVEDARGTKASKRNATHELNKLYDTLEEFAEKKIQLAVANYDLIDQHVKFVDKQIELLEASLEKYDGGNQENSSSVVQASSMDNRRGGSSSSVTGVQSDFGSTKRRKTASAVDAESSNNNLNNSNNSKSSNKIDGEILAAIDPNEPVYCSCRRIAFGEMIACDNEACPVEWFHYSCVGLTKKPKNDWYCPTCKANRDDSS